MEHAVHGGYNLAARAEALAEKDAARLALGGGGVCEALVLFKEDRRVGQAEAVDALLYVADHEQAASAAGDGAYYVLLHAGDVLVLVDHHLGVAARQLQREGGGIPVLVREQLSGQVLRVGEVYQRAAALAARVLRVELQREVQQRGHGRGGGAHVAQQLRAWCGEVLCQLVQRLFARVAVRLHQLAQLSVRAERAEAGKAHRQCGAQRVPAALTRGERGVQ